ncbi:type II toxin-antitoxin system RelE/ParE family toxin [Granulicella sp. L46]|uniref:type II toxin-antitoxin system RelE/ParE family toxin n=1 Tax=Granulicella sp. L46 TaxID=1641865 RepID=UPI00131C2AFF|nr:type II toxin-antitoxin system RelE/ParE family toxin [Granulicella sp. L46]
MIISFKNEETLRIFDGSKSRKYAGLQRILERKLRMLHRARILQDLTQPPGNRLERLRGDRAGRYSIRVNDQFRICFRWEKDNAYEVEIVDYH